MTQETQKTTLPGMRHGQSALGEPQGVEACLVRPSVLLAGLRPRRAHGLRADDHRGWGQTREDQTCGERLLSRRPIATATPPAAPSSTP